MVPVAPSRPTNVSRIMNHERDLYFVIPTYRLREVGETVEHYDEHFWRNGHSVRMIVFDDSSPANQEKYYPLLEQTKTHNDLYYVGPREKEQFLAYLNRRLRDKRLEGLVKNLFRPSYGGNRNFTLMYTLGGLMVSADDDMRPYALMEHSPESLDDDEVCRGRLHKAGQNGYTPQVVRHPLVLPRRAGQAGQPRCPTTTSAASCSSTPRWTWRPTPPRGWRARTRWCCSAGALPDDAVVKMAQTFRSGTNDIDAIDFVDMFLDDEEQIDPDELNDALRAGQLPPGGDEEELADGLRRGRLRQHLRPAAVLPDAAPLRGLHLPALGPAGRHRCRPTSMPPRTTPRATTCATRRPAEIFNEEVSQPAQAEDQGHASRASTS